MWCIRKYQSKNAQYGKYYAYSSNVLNSKKKKHEVNRKLGSKRIIFPEEEDNAAQIIKGIRHIYIVMDDYLDENKIPNINQVRPSISAYIHLNNLTDVLGKDDIALKE
ncbi:hypothetical protein J6P04_03450 [bacterium]|nr:hypothetical protein [bacterium]